MALWLFVALLIAIHIGVEMIPPKPGANIMFAAEAFVLYVVCAALAAGVEQLRQ